MAHTVYGSLTTDHFFYLFSPAGGHHFWLDPKTMQKSQEKNMLLPARGFLNGFRITATPT